MGGLEAIDFVAWAVVLLGILAFIIAALLSKQPLVRRALFVMFGALASGAGFIALGSFALMVGRASGRFGIYSRTDAPFTYWFLTAFQFTLGTTLLITGIKMYRGVRNLPSNNRIWTPPARGRDNPG